MLAGEVSGSLKSADQIAQILFNNLADFVLFMLIAGLALWWTKSFRDFLFFSFCAGSGFLLIMQNFQNWGVITLMSGAAVGAEILARNNRSASEKKRFSLTAGAQLLFFAFILPSSIHHAAALGLHTGLASLDRGKSAPLSNFGEIKLVQLWSEGDYTTFSRYFSSIADGARALSELEQNAGQVLVLDFVSPFSAGLGLKGPYGDSTWHHWGRTVNEHSFMPARKLFHDVRVIMEPKWPVDSATAEGLKVVYGTYIEDHYELAEETADWKVYVLRSPPAETVSRSSGSDPDEARDRFPPNGG